MRDYRDAKAMAQTLREALSEKNVSLSHSESLELMAKALGIKDWNTLSARINADTSEQKGRRTKAVAKVAAETTLPVLPLRDVVVFPNMTLPLFMGRCKTIHGVEHAMKNETHVFLVAQKVDTEENPTENGLYKIGTVGSVLNSATAPDEEGFLMSFVRGHHRASLRKFEERDDFNVVTVEKIEDDYGDAEKTQTLLKEVLAEAPPFFQKQGWRQPSWRKKISSDAAHAADAMASWLKDSVSERQELLETISVAERLEKLLALMRQSSQAA